METGQITYYGTPEALREYIHVEDAAHCSVEILKPEYANQHIVLTGHQQMKVGNVLKMISEMLGKNIEFNFQKDPHESHYTITPYSFNPRVGKKMVSPLQIDLGQGVLKVMEYMHKELNPSMHDVGGPGKGK